MELLPECLALSRCCMSGAYWYCHRLEEGNIRGKESSVRQQSKQEARCDLGRQRGCLEVKGKVILRCEEFGSVWGAVKNDFP